MQHSITKALSALIIVGTPLTAIASTSLALPPGTSAALTAAVLTIGASGVAAKRRWSQSQFPDTNSVLVKTIEDHETHWRKHNSKTYGSGDIESVIFSFKTYIETVGTTHIADLLDTDTENKNTVGASLLEHAESLYPSAYREFNRRGKEDQTTKLARKYFLDFVQAATRQLADTTSQKVALSHSGVTH